MDSSEEKALAARLAQMDETAWEQLAHAYSQPLLGFARFCLNLSPENAEEAVQMTFLRCVRSIETFDPCRGRLLDWLKAVARNEAHTFLRGQRHAANTMSLSALPDAIAERILDQIDQAPLADEIVQRNDVRLLVQETLSEINSRHRDMLVMKYLEGLKMSEIAARMGVSEKAVESLLTRARETFRGAFTQKLTRAERLRT